ncbi:pyridoxal phosphate phosphatase PHOSPHO2 [Lingula anatina]|uniref:Pyridoxal phosphate phosphatase PHOSPHO2 n=1 Tax=Lingula anatina TaxID=7574 RepID=A0A1S3IYV4_LINAN|nr:pyridoxal phosphate phosphatase PHOSPHO2 [Lingula anatina]|eukprot:XP_013402729.1 pyridoxal phosphate phosphatase PHOSPHO2 [Lingula anatina]
MTEKKILVSLDFDHTIIDDNSDTHVTKLLPNGEVPEDTKSMYSNKNWTRYMGAIFEDLHKQGVLAAQIHKCMHEIEFTQGMTELIKYLGTSDRFEVIIISDSNSIFIDTILEASDLKQYVDEVYTNPAEFDCNGCLRITNYHTQDWCDLSTINLCKGHILETHIAKQKSNGIQYQKIAYIGDGSNDLCACLKLGQDDLIFPRRGFRLLKKIEAIKECNGQEDVPMPLEASIHPWDNALHIEEVLHSL